MTSTHRLVNSNEEKAGFTPATSPAPPSPHHEAQEPANSNSGDSGTQSLKAALPSPSSERAQPASPTSPPPGSFLEPTMSDSRDLGTQGPGASLPLPRSEQARGSSPSTVYEDERGEPDNAPAGHPILSTLPPTVDEHKPMYAAKGTVAAWLSTVYNLGDKFPSDGLGAGSNEESNCIDAGGADEPPRPSTCPPNAKV